MTPILHISDPHFVQKLFPAKLLSGLSTQVNTDMIMSCLTCSQGCEWNERSINWGPESTPRLGSDDTFFWDSCSNLEIDENFRISHKLGLGLAEKFSKAFAIQLDRYRGQYTPRPSAHPPKNPYLVCWCTLSGTCVDQMCLPPPHFPPPTFPTFSERDYFQRQYL